MNLIKNIEIKDKGFIVEREDNSKYYFLFNKIVSFRLMVESGKYIPKNCDIKSLPGCPIYKLYIAFDNDGEYEIFTGCQYINSSHYHVDTFEEAVHINTQINNLYVNLQSLLN